MRKAAPVQPNLPPPLVEFEMSPQQCEISQPNMSPNSSNWSPPDPTTTHVQQSSKSSGFSSQVQSGIFIADHLARWNFT